VEGAGLVVVSRAEWLGLRGGLKSRGKWFTEHRVRVLESRKAAQGLRNLHRELDHEVRRIGDVRADPPRVGVWAIRETNQRFRDGFANDPSPYVGVRAEAAIQLVGEGPQILEFRGARRLRPLLRLLDRAAGAFRFERLVGEVPLAKAPIGRVSCGRVSDKSLLEGSRLHPGGGHVSPVQEVRVRLRQRERVPGNLPYRGGALLPRDLGAVHPSDTLMDGDELTDYLPRK
jgi:hypothetical protein